MLAVALLLGALQHVAVALPFVAPSGAVVNEIAPAHHHTHESHQRDLPERNPSDPWTRCHRAGEGQACCIHAMSCCIVLNDARLDWPGLCQGALGASMADNRTPDLPVPKLPPRLLRG